MCYLKLLVTGIFQWVVLDLFLALKMKPVGLSEKMGFASWVEPGRTMYFPIGQVFFKCPLTFFSIFITYYIPTLR